MVRMHQLIIGRLNRKRHIRQPFTACKLLATALLAGNLAISPASAQYVEPDDIAPFEVVYKVGNHLINAGTARLQLSREGDLWSYSLSTEPRGILKLAGKGNISESSTIRFTEVDGELQFQPQTYVYRQDNERRRAVDAVFDWNARSVKHTYRGQETTNVFEQPIIDRLSATLLMIDTLRKDDFEAAVIQVFDTGKIKNVAFTRQGSETLDTPLGKIETIKILNKNAAGSSRETITWFAPSLDFVPVKIEQRKRGDLVVRFNLLRLRNRVTDITLEASSD